MRWSAPKKYAIVEKNYEKNRNRMKAKYTVYADRKRNTISNMLFGHFMEHAGDVIYGGILDETNKLSDEKGFREDVCAAIKESGASTLRYPGGNFVSNYHWEDGIGPKENRPKVYDYAWLTEDNNRMGTVEFIELCRKVGAEPYICVNMGSGTAEEAMHWVEFCNGKGNTKYAAMRKALGYEEPFNVKYWGLGNEMYGDWQFASCSAEDYAKKAKDFAKAMKWVDPSISLVAAGFDIDSDWNRIVAGKLNKLIDHIAIHHYSIGYGVFDDKDYYQCMYIPEYLDKLTKVCMGSVMSGTNDALTNIKVAWDEWNTYAWNLDNADNEETYTLSNALLTSLILHSFIRNSNIIDIASYSPFVNKCGAIRTSESGLLKRAQYYVFEMLSKAFYSCNQYLVSHMECDTVKVKEVIDFSNRLPEPQFALNASAIRRTVETPYVDGVAALNEAGDMMVISIVNKHETEDIECGLTLFGFDADLKNAKGKIIYSEDMQASNSFEYPDRIVIKDFNAEFDENTITLKKHSHIVLYIPKK